MSHVFADYIKNLIVEKKNPLPIIGNGEQIRCFTWIEDIASAIAKFSFIDKTDNKTYNLGNPEPITMKQLAKMIYNGEEELQFETVKEYADDVKIRIPCIDLAKEQLGFQPTVKVEEAVKICVDSFNAQQ